jgi:hypothetical protein
MLPPEGASMVFPLLRQAAGVMEWWSIAKSQIPILNDHNGFGISNFGHCYLFDI